jgi:hypothetical protein
MKATTGNAYTAAPTVSPGSTFDLILPLAHGNLLKGPEAIDGP